MQTKQRLLDVAEFLLKLAKERNMESKALIKAGANSDAKLLLDEAALLGDGFDVIMTKVKEA